MKIQFKYMALAVAALLSGLSASAQNVQKRDSVVVRPWGIVENASSSAGSTVTLFQSDLEHSAVTDFRNRLTGLLPGLDIREISGALDRTSNFDISMAGGNYAMGNRGFSSMICIVDDVPVPFDQLLLDPEQIESVSLLSDVADKALFGPVATAGAIYITTKKGGYNTPNTLTFDVESGIGLPDVWPEWANGYDYASLNNQARAASGYAAQYSNEYMNGLKLGDPYSTTTPSVDYKSLIYRNFKPVTRFGLNAKGGNNTTKYNISLTGLNDNGLLDVAEYNDYYKANLSASVTTKLGKYVEAGVNAIGMLSFYRYPTGYNFSDYWSVPAAAFPVSLASSLENGVEIPTYAVSQIFTNNPYADVVEKGTLARKHRSGMVNLTLDADLSFILPGLKSRTFANFNTYFYQTVGMTNDYFGLFWESGKAQEELERSAHIYSPDSERHSKANGSYQGWNAYERLSYDKTFGDSRIDAGLTYYMSSCDRSGNSYYERIQSLILNAKYSLADKLFAELVLNYSGSTRFDKDSRFALLPTVALAWKPLENIKVFAQAGILGDSDVFGSHYLYNGLYKLTSGYTLGQATSNPWFGGTTQTTYEYTTLSRLSNPDLTWAKYFQADLGFEANLGKCLNVGLNLFRIQGMGLIAECTAAFPDLTGKNTCTFYDNYNANNCYGAELSASFNKSFGDFRLGVGGWLSTARNIHTKLADDIYQYDWQKKTGTRNDAIWGYKYIGKFASESEIANSATYGSDVKAGDLKYEDLSGDGKIDANDTAVIGHSSPDLCYALNLNLGWKGFDLNVVGTGRAFYQILMTNTYFWNGWGDGNYSQFVLENIGGDYPRLSYLQATDNFLPSEFWLRDGGFFKIQNIDLGYTFNFSKASAIKSMRINLRGSNLLTLTGVKYVDPENTNLGVGTEPLYKTFTAGIKFNF